MTNRRLLGAVLGIAVGFAANAGETPELEDAARLFADRCVLCHGNDGMGDGILSLSIEGYPSTNLHDSSRAVTETELVDAIAYGGTRGTFDPLMPPWHEQFDAAQLEGLARFIVHMREDPASGIAYVNEHLARQPPTTRRGKQIYRTHCYRCHGDKGEGDGRFAKVIKNPPPSDLTASRLPESYLAEFIANGGEAMGRSTRMPPWGDQLTRSEIDSVVMYVLTIRD